jgi:hypothetical protein
MESNVNDNAYTKTITNALTTAQEMLNANNLIFEKVLPAGLADDTAMRGRGVDFMFNDLKSKIESGMSLQPHEVITVNRALVEYVQKVELAQSHFMYMNEDLNNLSHFKTAIRDIHNVQIEFNKNVMLDAGNKADLDGLKNRMNQRPRP